MFSNSYSSLEEAWGIDTSSSGSTKRSKSKSSKASKMRDPICELYELGGSPSRAYTEMDVMNAIGPAQPATRMQLREPELEEPIEVPVQKQAKQAATSSPAPIPTPLPVQEGDDDDDMSEFIGYIDKRVSQERKAAQSVILPYADMGLYMISGIILIFMMEQFIKIGMAMRGY